MILMRLRRSLPAMEASTGTPASSSTVNIPALNFSTTLPITSIESSFDKLFSVLSIFEFPAAPSEPARAANQGTIRQRRTDRTMRDDANNWRKFKGIFSLARFDQWNTPQPGYFPAARPFQ